MENDTWTVIDSYFKDTPDYLVKHQLDSFNDFVNNKINKIFRDLGKKTHPRTDYNNKNIIYETTIYYGGKTHDEIYISKPTIIDYNTNERKPLYPNEARLKNATYGADIYYNVDIEFSMKDIKTNKYIYENIPIPEALKHITRKIYLGNIPIMLKSNLCILEGATPEMLYMAGESKFETGGYFIIDGAEKACLAIERRAENIIFYEKPIDVARYTHEIVVKSNSQDGTKDARTIKLQMEKDEYITVRLGQNNPFIEPNEGRDVPLAVMFRALGVETDKQIYEYVAMCNVNDNRDRKGDRKGDGKGDSGDSHFQKRLENILRMSFLDPIIKEENIYDQHSALTYLAMRTQRSKMTGGEDTSDINKNMNIKYSYLYSTIYENLFPHVGNEFIDKVYYLAYMTNKLIQHVIGLIPYTDKDNFINKRIDLAGFLMARAFRNMINNVDRNASLIISGTYERAHSEYSNENYINIINEQNYYDIFDKKVFDEFYLLPMKRGNIRVNMLVSKIGIMVNYDRRSYYSDLAILRRISDQVTGDSRMISDDRRRLHGTQYGCVCPVETPEGQNVGLRKSLAMMSIITFGSPVEGMIKLFYKLGMVNFRDIRPREIKDTTKIFINGMWVGIIHDAFHFYNLLIIYRRNGLFNVYNSISWLRRDNEIHVNTEQGRFCRPLYIIENNEYLIQPHIIEKLRTGAYKWNNLISGFAKRIKNREFDVYDINTYLAPLDVLEITEIGIRDTMKDIYHILHKYQSVIEYIDCAEFDNCMLMPDATIKDRKTLIKYTHREIHPIMNLGSTVLIMPYIEHNLGSRNSFTTNFSRQAVSMYASNYKYRIDTSGDILHYPERPLLVSRLNEYVNNDILTTGQTITVAILVYDGHNQEDGIEGNQKSLDLGLFNSTRFKRYAESEKTEKNGASERFYMPNNRASYVDDFDATVIMRKDKNYGNLDEFGFIKEGTILQEGDVIFGKYISYKLENGQQQYKDISVIVKDDHVGCIIDKVYTTFTNNNKDRLAKARVAHFRKPIIGDKFASRNAQKGTFGMILRPEELPFSAEGITPDFILNAYGYPKRMTVGQFLEILNSKLCLNLGYIGLASPFDPVNIETVANILEANGINRYCDTVFYNGKTGEMMNTLVFSGPIYYQRLKHMVHDKINSRDSGKRTDDGLVEPGSGYDKRTRQTVQGRANHGGLRVGEMERDALLSHGVASMAKESMMDRADKYYVYISKSGFVCIANHDGQFSRFYNDSNIYYDPLDADNEQIRYFLNDTGGDNSVKTNILGLDTTQQRATLFHRVEVPYSFKLLIQEMEGLGMTVRIRPDKLKLKSNYLEYDDICELIQNMFVVKDMEELDADDVELNFNMDEDDTTIITPDAEQPPRKQNAKPDNTKEDILTDDFDDGNINNDENTNNKDTENKENKDNNNESDNESDNEILGEMEIEMPPVEEFTPKLDLELNENDIADNNVIDNIKIDMKDIEKEKEKHKNDGDGIKTVIIKGGDAQYLLQTMPDFTTKPKTK